MILCVLRLLWSIHPRKADFALNVGAVWQRECVAVSDADNATERICARTGSESRANAKAATVEKNLARLPGAAANANVKPRFNGGNPS